MNAPTQTRELIKTVGGPAVVGQLFGLTKQAVGQWYEKGVPAERVLPICRFAGFRVTPHQLRPDLYPNPQDGLPFGQQVREAA